MEAIRTDIGRQRGLYDPRFEHDACGIGCVVDIKGRKSHATVDNALKIVEKLEHRAGKDAAGETGDGVGILLQISHRFFSRVAEEQGIRLGGERDYGIGMFFFPQDTLRRSQAKKMFEIIVEKEGMKFLGWRKVPIEPDTLGQKALSCMPYIEQGFVERPADISRGLDFDRRLYVARREFEQSNDDTYVVSCSSRTVVYKGMFLVDQLRAFYPDLQDPDYESASPWSTPASPPTPTPAGSGPIPTALFSTTARSTPSGATPTGCSPGRRPCPPTICPPTIWIRCSRWSTPRAATPPCWTTPWSSWS